MKELAPSLWTWSSFSEEKQLDFNGFYLFTGQEAVAIDPPTPSVDDLAQIEDLGPPGLVLLTNCNHGRASDTFREYFGSRIMIHEADAGGVNTEVDGTFADGDVLAGALKVYRISGMKSPGECALHWRERRILFLGDALIGKPPGRLSLLPAPKIPDEEAARRGLERLRDLDFESLYLGDGVSLAEGGRAAFLGFLDRETVGA